MLCLWLNKSGFTHPYVLSEHTRREGGRERGRGGEGRGGEGRGGEGRGGEGRGGEGHSYSHHRTTSVGAELSLVETSAEVQEGNSGSTSEEFCVQLNSSLRLDRNVTLLLNTQPLTAS